MGLDYFCNQNNQNEIVENREVFFTRISRKRLSKKKNLSLNKTFPKNSNNIFFEEDLSNNIRKKSINKNISNFLLNQNNQNQQKLRMDNLSNYNYSTSSNSSTEDTKKYKLNIADKYQNNMNILFSKNETLRKNYYLKLICKGLLNINKNEIKNNTLFIFDWDDTLFFTTHLNPSKNNIFFYENENEKKMIKVIESYIEEILIKAQSKGTVLIITNSSKGWVEACAKFYYTNLIQILKNIYIISSRDLYQEKYPTEPGTWKLRAFNDLKQKFNFEECLVTNIICFGDDNNEIIAAKKLGESIHNCLIKTVKFRDKPNLKDILKQLILINEQILCVYKYPKSLTIQIDKKKNPNK